MLAVASCATVAERRSQPVTRFDPVAIPDQDAGDPRPARLLIPVQGITRAQLQDTFKQRRGVRYHHAIDIMARRGTPVVAAGDGEVARVYRHVLGGLCVYQYDAAREHVYYYAHLDRYAAGLREGMVLRRGDPIGYVGSTGNAPESAPHLHFALIKLGPERVWHRGTPLNPYPLLTEP